MALSSAPPLVMTPPSTTWNAATCFGSSCDVGAENGFLDLVGHIGQKTRDALKRSEIQSKKAALGEADPQAVAMEMVNANASLRQFTSVLSAALKSYQEIQRMAL